MSDFIQEYLINPINNGTGYNVYNTTILAIGFVLVVLFTIFLFKRFRIKIDRKFFTGLFPFIILGSVLRSLWDAGVVSGAWFVTPGVYFIVYAITLAVLMISLFVAKYIKKPYWMLMSAAGFVILIYPVSFLKVIHIQPLLFVIGFTSIFSISLFLIRRFTKSKFLSQENSVIILAHLFDASTTFTAIQLSSFWGMAFSEEHVLAGTLMASFGNWAIFLLKLAVIPISLWIVDKYLDDKKPDERNMKGLIKIAIFILGFAPGLRNLLSMMILG